MPRSARWTCWFNAWIDGHASSDDARDAVFGQDAAHDVLGLPGSGSQPLLLAWGELRSLGVSRAALCLPEPGDLYGLGGPPPFNEAATAAGEAVVLVGAEMGVVPEAVGRGVFWRVHRARPWNGVDQVGEAERHLREELLRIGEELTELDIARWQPELRDALAAVRGDTPPPLAPGYEPRAERLAVLAGRSLAICDLASASDDGTVSARERHTLESELTALSRAARHALVAACTHGHRR